jgi:hypothetical protein
MWTKAELEKLEKAYKNGLTEIEYDGQIKKFRNLTDLKSIIEEAREELGNEIPQWTNRMIYPAFRR